MRKLFYLMLCTVLLSSCTVLKKRKSSREEEIKTEVKQEIKKEGETITKNKTVITEKVDTVIYTPADSLKSVLDLSDSLDKDTVIQSGKLTVKAKWKAKERRLQLESHSSADSTIVRMERVIESLTEQIQREKVDGTYTTKQEQAIKESTKEKESKRVPVVIQIILWILIILAFLLLILWIRRQLPMRLM